MVEQKCVVYVWLLTQVWFDVFLAAQIKQPKKHWGHETVSALIMKKTTCPLLFLITGRLVKMNSHAPPNQKWNLTKYCITELLLHQSYNRWIGDGEV